jgi:hypothetical protein
MQLEQADDIIREIVPPRVRMAIAQGLIVGIKKHSAWDSDKGFFHYHDHLQDHLARMAEGVIRDADDGHTNGSAVVIRGMQLLDSQLQREEQLKSGG